MFCCIIFSMRDLLPPLLAGGLQTTQERPQDRLTSNRNTKHNASVAVPMRPNPQAAEPERVGAAGACGPFEEQSIVLVPMGYGGYEVAWAECGTHALVSETQTPKWRSKGGIEGAQSCYGTIQGRSVRVFGSSGCLFWHCRKKEEGPTTPPIALCNAPHWATAPACDLRRHDRGHPAHVLKNMQPN